MSDRHRLTFAQHLHHAASSAKYFPPRRPTSLRFRSSQHSIACLSRDYHSATIGAILTMLSLSFHRQTFRALLLTAGLFLFASPTSAQTSPHPGASPATDPTQNSSSKDDKDVNFGSPENEMRAKMEIKEDKKKYDEHVARAREVSQLALQLSDSYEKRQSFVGEDAKRMERMEKLTKKIRNDAGGSEADMDADIKDIPADMKSLVKRVGELADELQNLVEKTPRHVVSAAVIGQANRLLGLVQHLREVSR